MFPLQFLWLVVGGLFEAESKHPRKQEEGT